MICECAVPEGSSEITRMRRAGESRTMVAMSSSESLENDCSTPGVRGATGVFFERVAPSLRAKN